MIKNLTSGNVTYLSVFLLLIPAGIFFQDAYPQSEIFKGQSVAIVASWGIVIVSGALWLLRKSSVPKTRKSVYALGLLGIAWLVITTLERMDGQGFNYNTFLVPILIMMVISKPVTLAEAKSAAGALAFSTLIMIPLAEVLAIETGRRELSFNVGFRLLGLPSWFVGEGRWEGPFGNPNYAGPIVAFLIVYGLSITGIAKWLIVAPSFILLLASGSRSGFLGLVAGLAVYFVFSKCDSLSRLSTTFRVASLAIAMPIYVIFSLLMDPTLNGRLPIWPYYLDYWVTSPMKGVGTNFINSLVVNGEVPPVNVHAHNMILDLAGRNGTGALLLVVLALVLAWGLGLRSAKMGNAAGLALITSFIAIGLTEVHGSWGYLSEPMGWLIMGILISNGALVNNQVLKKSETKLGRVPT